MRKLERSACGGALALAFAMNGCGEERQKPEAPVATEPAANATTYVEHLLQKWREPAHPGRLATVPGPSPQDALRDINAATELFGEDFIRTREAALLLVFASSLDRSDLFEALMARGLPIGADAIGALAHPRATAIAINYPQAWDLQGIREELLTRAPHARLSPAAEAFITKSLTEADADFGRHALRNFTSSSLFESHGVFEQSAVRAACLEAARHGNAVRLAALLPHVSDISDASAFFTELAGLTLRSSANAPSPGRASWLTVEFPSIRRMEPAYATQPFPRRETLLRVRKALAGENMVSLGPRQAVMEDEVLVREFVVNPLRANDPQAPDRHIPSFEELAFFQVMEHWPIDLARDPRADELIRVAAENNLVGVIRLSAKHGRNLSTPLSDGATLESLASRHGSVDVLRWLRSEQASPAGDLAR